MTFTSSNTNQDALSKGKTIMRQILLLGCVFLCFHLGVFPAELIGRYVAVDNVCAWPNLTLLENGNLTATIFNQPHHGQGEGDVESWISLDGGRIWELGGVAAARKSKSNRMNVAAGVTHDGSVVVLAGGWGGAAFRERILVPLVCRSSDGGRTWRQTSEITLPPRVQNIIPFGDVVRGPGNLLVASVYSWLLPQSNPSSSTAFVLFSRDNGWTWGESVVIGEDDYNETALVRLKSNRWLAVSRTAGDGHLELFISEDEGQSWHSAGSLTPPSHHPGHLLELKDGRIVLTYGIRESNHRGIGYRVSSDEGRTWGPPSHLIHLEKTNDGGYPATVQLEDEILVTAYYSSGIPQHRRYHMGVVRWLLPKH